MFTLELAQEICNRVAADESLASICRDAHMPTPVTIWNWVQVHPQFRAAYSQARLNQAHTIADKLSDVRGKLWKGRMAPARANSLFSIIKWEAGVRNPAAYGGHSRIEPEPDRMPQRDLSKLTNEELDQLERLLVKAEVDEDPSRAGTPWRSEAPRRSGIGVQRGRWPTRA